MDYRSILRSDLQDLMNKYKEMRDVSKRLKINKICKIGIKTAAFCAATTERIIYTYMLIKETYNNILESRINLYIQKKIRT